MSDVVGIETLTDKAGTGAPDFTNGFNINGSDSGISPHKHTEGATEPSSPSNGDAWLDTDNNIYKVYIDGEWKDWLGTSAAAGATSQGDRGFVAAGLGYNGSSYDEKMNRIQYWDITTAANAADFGDLATGSEESGGTCSGTRAVVKHGQTGSGFPAGYSTQIDYFATATTGNASDFGDSTMDANRICGLSDGTKGVFAGGAGDVSGGSSYQNLNVIDYITIASTGNATDFGDLLSANSGCVSTNDNTRGIFIGGYDGSNIINTLQYITIATPGNATDFGDDLTTSFKSSRGVMADGTYGVWQNGYTGSAYKSNVIAYLTVQSLGNATDFGDISEARKEAQSTSNATKGHINGGSGASLSNSIEQITIATPGNSSDFADLDIATITAAGLSGAAS